MISESQESLCRDGQGEGASAETPHPTCAGKALLGSEDLGCCFPTLGTLQGLSAPREELHDAGHVLVGDADFGKGLATRTVKTVSKHLLLPVVAGARTVWVWPLWKFYRFCLFLYNFCMCSCAHMGVCTPYMCRRKPESALGAFLRSQPILFSVETWFFFGLMLTK